MHSGNVVPRAICDCLAIASLILKRSSSELRTRALTCSPYVPGGPRYAIEVAIRRAMLRVAAGRIKRRGGREVEKWSRETIRNVTQNKIARLRLRD